jgi:lipopolysaccharide/colanic/teichoic acid biosynthesis glycosyltransferase
VNVLRCGGFRAEPGRTVCTQRQDLLAPLNKHAREGGDARMFKIPDDPRVTKLGRLLRRYSVDELTGDMSLVGPRPLILEEDRHVGGWARRRLDLKPGMTGLWQISGRDAVPFGEMVKLDYLYVTTWSPLADIQILFRTLPVLGKGEQPLRWA